ncbi:MAG TPA: hypothetical protein PLJ34_11325 [Hyphomicrobiales bacterium]|nr:hypothetical protein [Kaistiaceae bacterium]HQF32024.1 hypothetical protein [Hyphomicrobiales bacterium]
MSPNTDKNANGETPFIYAEECDLALLLDRRTGEQFCLEKETWNDLVSSLGSGWRPGQR